MIFLLFVRADAMFAYCWRHLPASLTNGIHCCFSFFCCWPNQNFLLTLIQLTKQTKKVWTGKFWSFYPTLFSDNGFFAVVGHSKTNMQRMWQKWPFSYCMRVMVNLNTLCIVVVELLCSLVLLFYADYLKMIGDISTRTCTCAHTHFAPGVSLHGINIFMGGKTPHRVYTEIKVICVFLQKKRACSCVFSVCTYMSIHMHDCFATT